MKADPNSPDFEDQFKREIIDHANELRSQAKEDAKKAEFAQMAQGNRKQRRALKALLRREGYKG